MRQTLWMSLFSVGLLAWNGCSGRSAESQPSFALVTNGVADFWKPAQAGAVKAGEEFGAEVLVIMPSSMTDQTRKLEDLLTRGTDGIAISPINPENQTDIGAMVGLFEYNPPLILEALDRAGRLGKVQVIGFDENPMTLQGILDGTVVGTIVQSPYQYGYQSIRILHELHQKHLEVIPDSGFIDIPARIIDQSNVESFWEKYWRLSGKMVPAKAL